MTPVDHALTQATVIPYLLAHGLLRADSVDGLKVARRVGLNLAFAVIRPPGYAAGPAGWFVKHGLGHAGRRAVAHEHAAYRELNREPQGVGAFIPALVGYDPGRAIIVLELAGHYRNLHERRHTAQGFSPRFGEDLGLALGCLHEHRPPNHWGKLREAAPPWILRAHRPRPAAFRYASPAELEVVKLLQHSPPIRNGLDKLAADWAPQAFVHGDFRWENCVVADMRSVKPLMRIVDFEHASAGDPALDVGAAFAEYLRSWLSSMPVEPASTAAQLRDGAIRPVAEMHPEIAALWRAYARRRSLDEAEREAMLARSMDFAAVRLITAAFEEAGEAERLPAGAGRAIQLAESLFAWPWDTSAHLIGVVP